MSGRGVSPGPHGGRPRRYRLAGGLRVIVLSRRWTPTTAARLIVGAGSVDDGDETSGLAHMAEHLVLCRRDGDNGLERAVRAVGGHLSGGTTREYTAFDLVCASPAFGRVLPAFAGLTASAATDRLATERKVVIEEIRHRRDGLGLLWDAFYQALWAGHPLGRPVLGREPSVARLTEGDVQAFHDRHYLAGNMVLAISGAVPPGRVAEEWLPPFASAAAPGPPPARCRPPVEYPRERRRVIVRRDIGQCHLIVGYPGPTMDEPSRHALKLLNLVLGGREGGRLYRRLRVQKGLVYSVATYAACLKDAGLLAVSTSCAPSQVDRVVGMVRSELEAIAARGVPEAELRDAKGFYRGQLAVSFETNASLANVAAIEELLGRYVPLEESAALVEAVDAAEVRGQAERLLSRGFEVCVICGDPPAVAGRGG
ncbi:MAG: insulinase family protein [Acetobacteraceae bacterium]|nr:insulinase family protein [Acetobacteraceae bacterium]